MALDDMLTELELRKRGYKPCGVFMIKQFPGLRLELRYLDTGTTIGGEETYKYDRTYPMKQKYRPSLGDRL